MHALKVIGEELLQGFHSDGLNTTYVLACLGVSILFGLLIYAVYRLNCQGGFYDRGFNKSLVVLPVITAGIILAMRSNILVSLGMVGALSIVRFRNAVKEPMDLTYMFWSISVGIVAGIGLFELAAVLSLVIAVLIFALDLIPTFRDPFILVVNGANAQLEDEILGYVKKSSSRLRVRSRNITEKETEWILELKTRKPAEMVQGLSQMEGVISANLLSHDGDVRF